MRIALIADIHGNVPALEAVLADIAGRGADLTLCLGDIASGPGWPAETIRLLQSAGVFCLRGNHDRWLSDQDPATMAHQDRVAYGLLTPSERAWLMALPTMLEPIPGLLAVHGTPADDDSNLMEEVIAGRLQPAAPALIRERLGPKGMAARIVVCGHSHRPGVMQLPGGPLVVNPGSVGLPGFRVSRPPAHRQEAGAPHARYALLKSDDSAAEVAFLAVGYDWERAAQRAEELGFSPAWAHLLRTGFLPESMTWPADEGWAQSAF